MEINRIINFYDQGVEIPSQLKTALLHLFDVDNIDDFFSKNITKLREVSMMFCSGYKATYADLAKEYAFYYLPINMFKVWKPLLDLAIKQQIRSNFSVLEFGSGPGSSTFGVMEFFKILAEENPNEDFCVNFTLLEKEPAFLSVFNDLFNTYKSDFPQNLKVSVKSYNQDIFDDLSFLSDETYDLILESNVFNQNEGVLQNEIKIFEQLSTKLNPHSSIIMIEPGRTEMLTSLHKIKNYFKVDHKLNIYAPCSYHNTGFQQYATAALKIGNISLLQELYKKGIEPKDKDYHYFEYLVLRNDTLITHTNSCQNTTPLNELKNYRDHRVNLEVNVLYTQVNDKVINLKICDGTILGKTRIDLYIPLSVINQTKIDKAKIDRGARIRVKKAKVIYDNLIECDECSSIEIER